MNTVHPKVRSFYLFFAQATNQTNGLNATNNGNYSILSTRENGTERHTQRVASWSHFCGWLTMPKVLCPHKRAQQQQQQQQLVNAPDSYVYRDIVILLVLFSSFLPHSDFSMRKHFWWTSFFLPSLACCCPFSECHFIIH